MQKFTKLCAKVVPLALQDIDTDQIVPARFLTNTSREGFAEALFCDLKQRDPSFVFNRAEFAGAEIIVADNNFGCGSSREHAVWAIQSAGFKVVISKSFADIFSSNSAKNGLLLVTLPPPVVDRILIEAVSGQYVLDVDLAQQQVVLPDGSGHTFAYDSFRKHCLLHGLDDIDYVLSHRDEIARFRAAQEQYRFFNTCEHSFGGLF